MRLAVKVVLGIAVVCLASGSNYAQQSGSSDASLGSIARQLKAQKAKEPKPVIVITNDTISTPKDASGAAASKKGTGDAASSASATAEKHDAEYYRSRESKLQDQLEMHKRELAVLQQKLGQNQVQYYPNPQDSLMQQYSRGDIDKLTTEIDAKKQQIDGDEKALDDLREQLRHEGGDPGWLRQ